MKPWLRWTLVALFLAGLLVIQFIPGEGDSSTPLPHDAEEPHH